MASFQIYQDAEKENPQNHGGLTTTNAPLGILKERKALGLGIMGSKHAAGQQQQAQTRSNISVHNINANVGQNGGGDGVKGGFSNVRNSGKLALRETGNTKILKAENKNVQLKGIKETKLLATSTTSSSSLSSSSSSAAIIKGNKNSVQIETTTTTTKSLINTEVEVEEELINISTELEFGQQHHPDGNINDKTISTPMSVSDMFSPMSVDRSNILSLDQSESSSSLDKENHQPDLLQHLQQKQQQKKIELNPDDSCTLNISNDEIIDVTSPAQSEKSEQLQLQPHRGEKEKYSTTPRNDRQRFFEVVEYQDAILEYFREGEKKHRPKSHYMRRQPDINYSMRTILVDWLVEVSEEYNLDTETLYLSISYIDRFLSHMSVVRSKLQLVGTAAMYIAAKYEEIYPPDVGEFVFITDDTYTKAQVLRMEQLILKILAFDLCTPTPYVFVNTYAVLTDMTNELKFLTMYICELSLLEAEPYLRYVPSIISAAAHALARYILDYTIWSAHLEEVTTYRLEDLKEVFLHLCKTHNAAATLPQQAIQEKYKTIKYNEVATLKPVDITAEQYDKLTSNYNETSAAEKERLEREQANLSANNENVRRMISLMFN